MNVYVGYGITLPQGDYSDVSYEIESNVEYISSRGYYGYVDYGKWDVLIYVLDTVSDTELNYYESKRKEEYPPFATSDMVYQLDTAHRIFTGYGINQSNIKLMVIIS